MNIDFSENIKRFRKERDLTQEALADYLGVSFQTISKWERGESYPDIKMLAEIAAFFNITADELLGADKIKKEQAIKNYLELFHKMRLQDVSGVLAEFEKAVKEFPNEYALLVNYMELLHIEKCNVHVQDYKPFSDKLIWAYEKIQKYCTDDTIRIRAKRIMIQHLMWQYQCLGWFDDEKKFDEKYKMQAESIWNTLPSISDSREYVFLELDDDHKNFENTDWYTHRKNVMESLSYLLQNVIISYCYYDDHFTPEYKIEAIKHMNGIFQMTDTSDCPTKNRIHIIYNYGHLGHLYAEIGNNDQALHYLRLATEQAVLFDHLPDAERIALFYERGERFQNMSMCDRMYELMTKHYSLSDEFKATPAFQEIISMMK